MIKKILTILLCLTCNIQAQGLLETKEAESAPTPSEAPAKTEQKSAPAPTPSPAAQPSSITIQAHGLTTPKPPLFFSATTSTKIHATTTGQTSTTEASFTLLQGDPTTFTLKLIGDGEITNVTSDSIQDWSIRHNGTTRLLDIRAKKGATNFKATITANSWYKELPATVNPITFAPGKAVGYSTSITVTSDPTVAVKVTTANGLAPAEKIERTHQFHTQTDHTLTLQLTRAGAAPAPAELQNASLTGTIDPTTHSATFTLTGQAIVTEPDATIDLLSGHAAITTLPESPDFTLSLKETTYQLTFPQPGTFPISIQFQAGIIKDASVNSINLRVPAGTVVPVSLTGIEKDVRFDPACPVLPTPRDDQYVAFLPADGECHFAWQSGSESTEGKLFFSSDTRIETRVGAGLMRQVTAVDLRILQGKLNGINFLLEGDGEILGVEGDNVLSWSVAPAEGKENQRQLTINSRRPATAAEKIVVRSQSPLGEFPVEATPLRITPQGAVRHSGYLHVLSEGAVGVEIIDPTGLIQMAPGAPPAGVRQIFLYRFPSAQHSYRISARQIMPELNVSQTTIYQMTETDRVISGSIELDITKAPVREWSLRIPENYTVSRLTGASVADYIHPKEAKDGTRPLKIIFNAPVADRQLIEFQFERNTAAAEGDWKLPALTFPEAKSIRGNIGVATVPGYRASPGELVALAEIPQNLFPLQLTGLQQTFRQREPNWSATINIEALPQSVQADVYHLYSLKEGIAYGSVLIDYAIIGSPVSEWRIAVPKEIGNLAIESQDVQSWRREGDQVVITLHQPALGETTLLLTFEQPMDPRNGILNPGQVAPVGVQGERGYIQVVSPSQVRQEIAAASDGLVKMEPSELPAELQALSSSPSLAIFQYTSRPFQLQMNVQWFQPGDTVDQVVDFANLVSQVSSDGQVVTEARLFVKTRGRKALRMTIPKSSKLWETRVNDIPVSARIDGTETLIPLPASIDPSRPVPVFVRIGQTATDPNKPSVTSPTLLTPTLINSWKVKSDPDRRLLPTKNNTAELARPVLTETGFEWLQIHRSGLYLPLAIAILLGAIRCCAKIGSAREIFGFFGLVAATIFAVVLANEAANDRRVSLGTLEFIAPVVEAGESLTLNLKDHSRLESLTSTTGLIALAIGVLLIAINRLTIKNSALTLIAWALALGGLLAQHGGAPWFFSALAACITLTAIFPMISNWITASKNKPSPPEPDIDPEPESETPVGITSTILLLACGLAFTQTEAKAATTDIATQKISIEDSRLQADLDLTITGKKDDVIQLFHVPVTLTSFESESLRLAKTDENGYSIVLERNGTSTAKIAYQLPIPDITAGFSLPTSSAAIQSVTIQIDQAGWEITSPEAVKTQRQENLPVGTSAATLTLRPSTCPHITLQPMSRDLASEEAKFFAETSNLFIPGPGLVDGRHRITIRPSRGQLTSLDCTIPDGFTVSDVLANDLTNWRFDPDAKSLQLTFNPPVSKPFAIIVETQRGSPALPTELTLTPLSVKEAEGQVGTLAVAFASDAQLEKSTTEKLSKINHDDFDQSLLKPKPDTQPLGNLSQAYRYGKDLGSLKLTVAPVAPDVRAHTNTTLSLGEERLVIAVDLTANITRAGIFKLSFPIPAGLDIEAASGDSLASHIESTQDGQRIVTLHLKGRTLGQQKFAITLAGASPAAQEEWAVPKFTLREASRQTGQLLVVPEQGIRTQPVSRNHVSQLDARKLSQNRPGTLAFRLLEADWELKLRLDALSPWVTAQILQDVTAREGLTKNRLTIAYKVENAAVKSLPLKLPGLGEDEQKTVRASGNAVSHIEKIEGEDMWQIHFQRRILGDGTIDIDYQRATERADGIEKINIAELPDTKQSAYWVAVRVSGHLEAAVSGTAPQGRGWQEADWSGAPKNLLDARNRAVPALAFRAVDPDQPLTVKVQRHSIADALRLSIRSGDFTTAVAPDGASVTEANLKVEVVEKSTLRVVLPPKTTLISAFVNGQSPGIVRESKPREKTKRGTPNAYLFYVLPREQGGPADVTIAWSSPSNNGRFNLVGPSLNVPLQNITWRVIVPNGLRLAGHDGNLDQSGDTYTINYGIKEYAQEQKQRISQDRNEANQLMQQANVWKSEGKQEKARSAFSKLSKKGNLDQATSEDARVQLRELQEERTLLSLATRRQKNYLDNRSEDPNLTRNAGLEQAANVNPLLQGQTNYRPDQLDAVLAGNTSEETNALKRITARLVSQQLAAEPAPQAIAINIPKHGQVLTFKRSIQVNGDTPLQLNLKLKKQTNQNLYLLLPILLALALITLTKSKKAA